MRIAQLQLIAYGPFRGQSLDLSAPGVHVVFGRNEAGKSTTLRAITGLLYGIPAKTPDAHVHKMPELRIGGTLVGADGGRLTVVRRKGAANTLVDEHGQPVDETVLQRLLHGVGEDTFKHAFGLDHETLAEGAKALLEGRGDIGGSLFDASVGGGADVRRLLNELESEADGLYKARGTTLPLNVALKAFADLQRSVKEKERLPAAFILQQNALADAQTLLATLNKERAELSRRRAQIESARQRVPLARRRTQAQATLAELAEIVRHAPRIAALSGQLAGYLLARTAQQEDGAAADRLRVSVADAARHAGVAAGQKDLRIDARTQSRIQKYVQERTTSIERLASTRRDLARSEQELAKLRAEVHAPASADPVQLAALARSLDDARKLGDAASLLATQTARAARRRAEVEVRVASLGIFTGTLEQLVATRPPSIAVLDELIARATRLDALVTRHDDRRAELEREAQTIEQQLAQASGDFAPPTKADLEAARQARAALWSEVQDARIADASAVARLDAAFDRALRDADAIADRMIIEADRVTQLARYRAQQTTNARQRAQATDEWQEATARRAALDREHQQLWVDAGVVKAPGELALAQMRAWLGKHQHIVEALAGVREAEADADETARAIAGVQQALEAALVAVTGIANEPRSLASLVDRATAWLDGVDSARRAAAAAASAILKNEALLDERRASALRDEQALADARTRLAELVAPLGIPEDADADEVTQSLEALRQLFRLDDQRKELVDRATAHGLVVTAFEEEARCTASSLAPELTDLPASAIVEELAARRARAIAAQEQLTDAESHLAETEQGETIADDIVLLAKEPDAALRALEEADTRLVQLDDELRSATRDAARIEVGLDQMRGESGAAEASAEAQAALARVRVDLERYIRAKTAAVLLAREIDRYREENQGPMLTRASSLFARLTLGSFDGVRAGYDDKDRPALRCVRRGNVEVDVTGLSEGTRDQLYLSLRFASLLRYADLSEPMPLVLDDLLIQFDDQRSQAALVVIAEMATRMQVLFFTHHQRMVDLARHAIPATSLTVHELGGPVSADASTSDAALPASP